MMNKETEEEYKGIQIVIIEAFSTKDIPHYGYRLPEVIGLVCYDTYQQALNRAKQVIDNPNLTNSMMSSKFLEPNPNWFK